MKIIGICGLSRSGKDTLAEWLIKSGYFGVSLGDIVRNHARDRHASEPDPISVANMTETSNWLRQTKGADFALQEAIDQYNEANKLKEYEGLLVYSVRAPAEVDFILEHGGELIWVETTEQVRHRRAMKHRREGEAKVSLEEFKRQENLQWRPQPSIPAKAQMNVQYVKSKSTIVLENNGDGIQKFKNHAQKALANLL